jgi:hypothetical protein
MAQAVAVVLKQLVEVLVMAVVVFQMQLVLVVQGAMLVLSMRLQQILHMLSLLRVISLCMMMMSLLERGGRGAHLMYGSTIPRRS